MRVSWGDLIYWFPISFSWIKFILLYFFLQLFSVIPRQFLPSTKSPCWYEEFPSGLSTDPYKRNLFTLRSKSFKSVCDRLWTNFHQHLFHRDNKLLRLRCLPYFYIIGQPKCGTTDLFHRLLLHPEVKFNTMKEPHWWTRKRFGKSTGGGCCVTWWNLQQPVGEDTLTGCRETERCKDDVKAEFIWRTWTEKSIENSSTVGQISLFDFPAGI